MREKIRLDSRLLDLGLTPSRERGRAEILAGLVYVNSIKVDKPSQIIKEEDIIEVRGKEIPFVSRGGLKLDKALKVFEIDVSGKICADIGASTGGFTDCLLQNGAIKVYSIDVGYGQLDWSLRKDDRVNVMERINARNMEPDWFSEKLQFACIDVSFISLKKILQPLIACMEEGANIVALIKPQFEAGRDKVGKKGVVRDPKTHRDVIAEILSFCRISGFGIIGLDYSPITGPSGNVEFLLNLKTCINSTWSQEEDAEIIKKVVEECHVYHKMS